MKETFEQKLQKEKKKAKAELSEASAKLSQASENLKDAEECQHHSAIPNLKLAVNALSHNSALCATVVTMLENPLILKNTERQKLFALEKEIHYGSKGRQEQNEGHAARKLEELHRLTLAKLQIGKKIEQLQAEYERINAQAEKAALECSMYQQAALHLKNEADIADAKMAVLLRL